MNRLRPGYPPGYPARAAASSGCGDDDARSPLRLTVLVPCHNEEENVAPLTERLREVLGAIPHVADSYEILFVDDGSTDGTLRELNALAKRDPAVVVATFRRNFGKAAALDAGFRLARGEVVITMDGDLQDDPTEIPRMLATLDEGFDVVSGWKVNRQDPLSKTLPSRVFNRTLALFSGVKLHDYNCGFKAYRREAVEELELYGELHRYIPVLLFYRGFKITEIPVQHHPRRFGKSKYGFERFTRGFFDLLTVILLTRYATRPLHAFGGIGLILGALGTGVLTYLTVMKFAFGMALSERPLLLLGILLLLVGVQLVSTGLLGEMLARSQSEAYRPFVQVTASTAAAAPRTADAAHRPQPESPEAPTQVSPNGAAAPAAATPSAALPVQPVPAQPEVVHETA